MSNLFCLVCSKSFPEAELSGHVASVHFGFLSFACTSCDFTAAQEAEVLQHADKEGHIPFVVDRSNTKPYLTSLSKQIVGHCKIFSVSKNFAEILAGLNSQIAADLCQLDGPKSEVQVLAVHDSETSSERSVNTPQSSLISNHKPDTDVCHSRHSSVASGLPEIPSRPVDIPKSNQSTESLTPGCRGSPVVQNILNNDVLPVYDQVSVGTMCALCASNEAFSVDQREGHVFQHLGCDKSALSSSSSNPAEYFSELAQMWQRCFPPTDLVADANSSGGIKASPERHATKVTRSFSARTHVKCLQCSKWTWKAAKSEHIWRNHMAGFDRFVCTVCGSKGMRKEVVQRGCSVSHSGLRSDIQVSSLSSQVFGEQFELCFGHPRPAGRSPRRSSSGSAPFLALAVTKPIEDAASLEEMGSSERRYPSTRRSLNKQTVNKTDVSAQSIITGKAKCSPKLSPKVHSAVLKRPRSQGPSGRLNRSLSPVATASKALKRRTERESSSVTEPDVPVTDSRTAGRVPDKVPKRPPKQVELPGTNATVCGLCQNRVRNVGYASHVWIRHMRGYQRLTCEVCGSKHNFLPRLHAECVVRHPETKPIIKMDQSRELRRKYERQYLQCFGFHPKTNQGFFKSAKATRPGIGGASNKVSRPNHQAKVALMKAAAKRAAKGPTAKCQLCFFKYDVKNLKRHALRMHFGRVVFECSECGYGHKADAYEVSNHVRQMHPGDANVRVVDHSAAYANEIQQCLDSCFPALRLSAVPAKGKRKRENESSPLLSEATIDADSADADQTGTSGYAAIESEAENAEETEQSGFASDYDDENDDENEASLALVKQELLLQSGHMKNAVVAIHAADVAAALKNVAVKTEGIDEDDDDD